VKAAAPMAKSSPFNNLTGAGASAGVAIASTAALSVGGDVYAPPHESVCVKLSCTVMLTSFAREYSMLSIHCAEKVKVDCCAVQKQWNQKLATCILCMGHSCLKPMCCSWKQ